MKRLLARLALVVGLVVAPALVLSAGPAQALQPSPLDVRTVEGIARALGPKVAARYAVAGSVCGTGVGCPAGIVAGIGITAYELYNHRDVWMPWVAGLLGEQTQSFAPGTHGSVKPMANYQTVSVPANGAGFNLRADFTWTAAPGGGVQFKTDYSCISPAGALSTYPQLTSQWSNPNPGASVPVTTSISVVAQACNNVPGAVLQSLKVNASWPGWQADLGVFTWSRAGAPTSVDNVIRCRKPDGTKYLVAQTTSNPVDGVHVRSCDAGDVPESLSSSSPTKSGVQDLPLQNDAQHDAEYPLCVGAVGTCGYSILIDGIKCQVGVYNCIHWSHIATAFPARVDCKYGTYSINLAECAWLERAFQPAGTDPQTGQPQGQPVTDPNTDGDPDTYTPPAPAPSWNPNPQPTPTPTPSPSPSGQPSSSPSPSSSSSPSPSSSSSGTPTPGPSGGPGSDGRPDPSDPESSKCWPSGWGWFRPDQWVLRPLQCAFVPDPSVVNSVKSSIGADVKQSGAADIADAIQDPLDAMSSGSGCQGITFALPIGGQTFNGSILNACSGPMAKAAWASTALLSLSTVMGGGMALLRLVGAGFGYNVRVSDGD